jgi:hypothetical protein
VTYASLRDDPIGTPHHVAVCCWCAAALTIGEVAGLRCWLCPHCYERQLRLALTVGKKPRALNVPLPSQCLFEESTARNVLWGGQAGPGKSHGARWWLYKRSLMAPEHLSLLLRENNEQLEKTHLREMEKELPKLGAKVVNRTAIFPNGSQIDCGHMAEAESVSRYLSTEYGAIVADEASRYPVDREGVTPLAELQTRARKVYQTQAGELLRPRFMPVSNPGGPSAPWLRDMFIDHTPDLDKFPKLKTDYKPGEWQYIPAKLNDNPYQDPEYHATLAALTGVRYKQLAEGDWYAFVGAFFGEWDESIHVRRAMIVAA